MSTPDVPMLELMDAKILRAAYSRRQLEAILTDFWFNHFHVRDAGITVGSYERDVIRPHVLGRFEDMLLAVARSAGDGDLPEQHGERPRRLVVDGVERASTRTTPANCSSCTRSGVDGGYTQQDVIALARCFTGWNARSHDSRDGFTATSTGCTTRARST